MKGWGGGGGASLLTTFRSSCIHQSYSGLFDFAGQQKCYNIPDERPTKHRCSRNNSPNTQSKLTGAVFLLRPPAPSPFI